MSEYLSKGSSVSIRNIDEKDLYQISDYAFTVSITEPLTDKKRLMKAFSSTEFWGEAAGAVAIIENSTGRLIGTSQFYRSAPCIHGLEIGYIVHERDDRGKGYAAEALRLLSDYLFSSFPEYKRHQLLIEVWNTASWKVAERCGFLREGVLRSAGFGTDPADELIYSRTKRDYEEELSSSNGS